MTTFIILGATGDLTKRKLIPAIYRLVKDKRIKKFCVIGAARTRTNMNQILKESKKFIKKIDSTSWNLIKKNSEYTSLNFYKPKDYIKLNELVKKTEKKKRLIGNRLFYLATLPQHFHTITANSHAAKLDESKGWTKVVYEKPFGEDLKSAKKINNCIRHAFTEKEVYRIDHYLGKELVGNIALVRFTNRILEPLWKNEHIENIQIILNENLGMEGRGKFYDKYGAIRDVVQNHMLQLVALIAMESPNSLTGNSIRNEKLKVLKKIQIKDLLKGQCTKFLQEPGVKKNSKTETFAAVKLEVNNKRWKGVPFYLKTGKYLKKKETIIYIKFKEVPCLLRKSCPSDTNYFIMRIQPNDGFSLSLNTKIPGQQAVKPVLMDFCGSCTFGPNTPKAYETLLEEVIKGNQGFFVRNDEIEEAWKITDKLRQKKITLQKYKKGEEPKKLKEWDNKNHVRWKA